MRIVFLGDIVGNPGRRAVKSLLPEILAEHPADLVIANVENAAGGFGLDRGTADELFQCGIQIFTTGNHIWNRKEIYPFLEKNTHRILRPANYPSGSPGVGELVHTLPDGTRIGIANVMGRVFMNESLDCPFQTVEKILQGWDEAGISIRFIDFHAEATSEKGALGYFLDGRVTAMIGTHTHVQTADERILPKGTAYQTDAGRCGVHQSVLGFEPDNSIARFQSGLPVRMEVAKGIAMVNGVLIDVDPQSGQSNGISRIFALETLST